MFVENYEAFLWYLLGFGMLLVIGVLGSLIGVLATEWRLPIIKRQKLSGVLGWQLFLQLLALSGSVLVVWLTFVTDLQRIPLVFQPVFHVLSTWGEMIGGVQMFFEDIFGGGESLGWFIPVFWLDFNIVILIYLPIVKILFFLATRFPHFRSHWQKISDWKRWFGVVVAFEAMLLLFGVFLAAAFFLDTWCQPEQFYLHIYNQHLKELCIESADKSQCPQNIDQLKAFQPQTWEKIEGCFTLTYELEEPPAKYKFEAKSSAGWDWEFKPEYVIDGRGGFKID
jgi:hypothetical protein